MWPIPFKPQGSREPEEKRKTYTEDDFYDTLTKWMKVKTAGATVGLAGALGGEGQPKASPLEAVTETAKGLKELGLDLAAIGREREEEIKSLRHAAKDSDKEIHEMRLRELEERERQILAQMEEGGGAGWLGKLHPDVQRQIQERALGLTKDEGHDSFLGLKGIDPALKKTLQERAFRGMGILPAEERPIHAVVSEYFKGFSDLTSGMREALKTLGFVSRDEVKNEPSFSLKDLTSGTVPMSAAVELYKIDREHEREMERSKQMSGFLADVREKVVDWIPDLANSLRSLARTAPPETQPQTAQGGERPALKCSACGYVFSLAVAQPKESYFCPGCGEPMSMEKKPQQPPAEEAEPETGTEDVIVIQPKGEGGGS